MLAHPNGDRSRGLPLNRPIGRHESRWTVVTGPVEFYAARNPGAKHADQRRLNNVLLIKEVIFIYFVIRGVDSAAQFRKQNELQILVFQANGGVRFILPVLTINIGHNAVRIGISRGTLMHAVLRKHGELLGRRLTIRWQG